MIFIYSVINQPGNEAIGSFASRKMLLPDLEENVQNNIDPAKPVFGTPTLSSVSTVPNTPGNAMMNGNGIIGAAYLPNVGFANMTTMPAMMNNNNTINAHPYLDNNSPSATTYPRKETAKLTRPVPNLDPSESKEFKGNEFDKILC